jgi:hypothetical protein
MIINYSYIPKVLPMSFIQWGRPGRDNIDDMIPEKKQYNPKI